MCSDANEGGTALIRPSVLMHRRAFYMLYISGSSAEQIECPCCSGVGDMFLMLHPYSRSVERLAGVRKGFFLYTREIDLK